MVTTAAADAAQIKSRNCKVTEVAVFSNRIHVKCAKIDSQPWTGDIPYYAMKMKEGSTRQLMVMDLLVAARTSGRSLRVWVDMADYQSVPGCKGSDCRRLHAVALR